MADYDSELSLPVENPFEVAAKRVRNAVKPEGGRKEGEFTKQFTESAALPSAIALKLLTGPFYAAGDVPGFVNEFMQRIPGSDLSKEEVERGFNAAALTGAGAGIGRVTSEMRLPKVAAKSAPIAEDQALLDHIIERGKEFEKESPEVQEMTQNKLNPNNPVEINAAPNMPQRPLSADYKNLRFKDVPNGIIQNDIEGRPLTAPIVAGRRIVGSGDQGLSPADIHRVATEGVQTTVNPTPRSQFAPGEAGSYNTRKNLNAPEHLTERNIKFNMALDNLMRERVIAHEVAHGIEHRSVGDDPWFAGGGYHISSKNMRDEMYRVYNDMNNENPAMIGKHPINENGHIGEGIEAPELRGYAPQKVPRELWAESIRAYMDNPNYMKTVAPETAKAIRQMVNSNPQLSKVIQFNAEGSVPGAAIAALSKPFYSAVENAIKGAKQSTANADQWLGTIKNSPGIKQEELNWTGLEDYIKSKEGKISKQELQDYMDNHKVELNEVNKSHYDPYKLNEHEYQNHLNNGFEGINPTKYSQYQLPGGENYREKLLTLPENKALTNAKNIASSLGNQIHNLNTIEDINIAKKFNNNFKESVKGLNDNEILAAVESAKKNQFGDSYKSSHWDEPNVLAHVRMNDRKIPDIGKTLHLEEIQSDWHQAGREKGYKTQTAPSYEEIQKSIRDFTDFGNELAKKYKANENPHWMENLSKEDKIKYDNLLNIYKDHQSRFNMREASVPNAPFKATWPDLVLKRMIREASEKGYDAISWSPGEVQNKRYPGRGIKEEEGMKEFYDKILVNKVNQLAKKFGGKVEQKDLTVPKSALDLVNEGIAPTIENLNKYKKSPKIHVLKLTPEMKDAALHKGFPLFSNAHPGMMFTPIDNHPDHKYTPIDHNPFE